MLQKLVLVFISFIMVYVASARGLSISRDGGSSFPASAFPGLSINAIFEGNNGLYVGHQDGLYRSTDKGASFTRIRNEAIVSVVGHDGKIYALTGSSILISDLSGTNFTVKSFPYTGRDIAVATVSGIPRIYVATDSGLAISTNEGSSFSLKTSDHGLLTNLLGRVSASGTYVYLATTQGLTVSANGGGTFTHAKTAQGLGSSFIYGASSLLNEVYVATAAGLSYSDDGGSSFINTLAPRGLGGQNIRQVWGSGSKILVAMADGLYRSIDQGLSFTQVTGSAEDIHVDNGNVFIGTTGGLWMTTIDGPSLSHIPAIPYAVSSVFAHGATLYAGTNWGLYISTDSGNSFHLKTSEHGLGSNYIKEIFWADGTLCVVTNVGLSISTDGGQSFVSRTEAQMGTGIINTVHVSGSRIHLTTYTGTFVSHDGGATFTRILSGESHDIFVSGSKLLIASASGLRRSYDYGVTFTLDTTTMGLGSARTQGVWASGDQVYVATEYGLAVYRPGL